MRKKTARETRESVLASGWTVEADPETAAPAAGAAPAESPNDADADADAGAVPRDDESDVAARPELSNGALVMLGVFGGLYLLYAWIWLSWAQFYAGVNAELAAASGALGALLQQLVFWAAPLAPLLWFLAALLLNREAGARRMALWIVIGAVVLLPLPVFAGGGS
ncbi:hypothetical protein [Leucobacter triazinivorans]|uniref:DNA polymerase III subunit gamma/tau n=1 Tax=Leucobacter triazinivorans TaxID=1784719 RepID=A0A4P6KDA4_9MICO|nr:hypothetical protein [Leucobacter triazinivorans]QBE47891.1 hypothetical protein EVS81_02835 [Leucobacter triazinivorans]